MKIAFIQCPSWSEIAPPYPVSLLSACLKQEGYEIHCFDLNIKFYNYVSATEKREGWGTSGGSNSWFESNYVMNLMKKYNDYVDNLVCQILNTDARIICFTVYDTSRIFSEEIARRVKEHDNNRIIIFGGPSCFRNSIHHTYFLEKPYIDAICLHEGELALLDLVKKFEKNKEIVFSEGFIYRDKSGKIIDCGNKRLIQNLDELPFADFSEFEIKEYKEKMLPISTSRGCIYNCAFCGEAPIWVHYRYRSAQSIYNEIIYQLKRYPGVKNFFFNDSLINGNIEMLDELASLIIKNKLEIFWGGQASIRKEMNFEFLKKLHKSGFSHVSYGLESGSPRILRLMRKAIDLKIAEEVIRNTYQLGIHTTVNIIVGFPGETEEDLLYTAEFIKRNMDFINEIYFHPLVVLPNSYLYTHRELFGIEFPEANWINLWYTADGKNNYEIRLKHIDFLRQIVKTKYASNISEFNYNLTLADEYYNKGDFDNTLKFLMKAKAATNDFNKINLIEERLKNLKRNYKIP